MCKVGFEIVSIDRLGADVRRNGAVEESGILLGCICINARAPVVIILSENSALDVSVISECSDCLATGKGLSEVVALR